MRCDSKKLRHVVGLSISLNRVSVAEVNFDESKALSIRSFCLYAKCACVGTVVGRESAQAKSPAA
jgi:hypothetical protein